MMNKKGKAALNYIFPEVCCLCHEQQAHYKYLCKLCLDKVSYLEGSPCPLCSSPLDTILNICSQCTKAKRPWIRGASALRFEDNSREIIHHFKYNGQVTLSHFLVEKMYQSFIRQGFPPPVAVTMVPMHWLKKWQRGYNQAEILARGLATRINVPCLPLIKRCHWTSAQALKNRRQRLKNILKVFEIPEKQKLPSGAILLVDDVMTTGATLTVCSKLLIDKGACQIYVLTAARG